MGQKILVISRLFEPENEIGALRPTKFVKCLTEKGYSIDVFTSVRTIKGSSYTPKGFRVIYDKEHSESKETKANSDRVTGCFKRFIDQVPNKVIRTIRQELASTYRQMLEYRRGKVFLQSFKNAIIDKRIILDEYQCVFTTFGPVDSVLVGLYIKKNYPQIKWINDFRDPMISQMIPKLFYPWYRYLQNKSIDMCDYAVTVSEGYYRRMVKRTTANKFHVIPNGYDIKDIPIFQETAIDNDQFSLVYVGSLYEGKRDIGPVFSTLRKLCDEGYISKNQMVFHYAGRDIKYLMKQAHAFDMDDIVFAHGMLSRQECLNLQASARFLVLSTWNDRGEEGVFPGKFIEYMLINRPIISVVDGNLANSEVTDTIRRYNLGVSYESADMASMGQLYEWMKTQVQRYNEGQPALFFPDKCGIDKKYNWVNIAKRFGELIEQ